MRAVVMAGGEGTRLRPMTANLPKPLLPVANRPIMEHVLRLLKRHGFDETVVDRVVKLVDAAEYKRRQYPPGTKISLRAFGRDRRLPITTRWRESSRTADRA